MYHKTAWVNSEYIEWVSNLDGDKLSAQNQVLPSNETNQSEAGKRSSQDW